MDSLQVVLSESERGALAFCVAHMIEKHGYSSIVSRGGLDELYDRLSFTDPEPWVTPNLRANNLDRGASGKHFKPRTRKRYEADQCESAPK